MSHHVEGLSSWTCLECGHTRSDHWAQDQTQCREPKFFPGKKPCIVRGCGCREFRQPHEPKILVTRP